MADYELNNRAYHEDDPELPAVLQAAHERGARPLCLCRQFSLKLAMVIEHRKANEKSHYILRRMPGKGHEHTPTCKHYEAPEGLTGRADHLGGAIRTDDDGAHHRLRLAFSLSQKERATANPDDPAKPSDPTQPRKHYSRLSLLGFLHHMLETAELNKMHKGIQGKRNWNVMRKLLLEAMRSQSTTRYRDLADYAFAPRIFHPDLKDELFRDWRAIERKAGAAKRSILLFAELKEFEGGLLTFKHLPQRNFALNLEIQRPFFDTLETLTGLMHGPSGEGYILCCAVVIVGEGDSLSIVEIAMTATTKHWIPFGSMPEYRLLAACDEDGRGYFKSFNYGQDNPMASLLLTDTGDTGTAIFIIDEQPTEAEAAAMKLIEDKGIPVWRVNVADGRPTLPRRR